MREGCTAAPDHVDVIVRPPVFALAAVVVGVVVHLVAPVEIVSGFPTWVFGIAFGVLALGLFLSSVREFGRYRTPVRGTEPVVTIVDTGPYGFSRNPIYLSFLLLQLGIALAANSLWILLIVAPTFLYLSFGVIPREERYLARKFGEEYSRYTESVRRWI